MTDLRTWWQAFRYDEWLFKWRSPFAGTFSVGIAFLLALLVWTILKGSLLGIGPIEIIEGLLAGGTTALAYAALVQAVSTEKARRANLRPLLDIQIVRDTPTPSRTEVPGAVPTNTFVTQFTEFGNLKCVLRNLGPGNAVKVRVSCPVWYLNEMGPWKQAIPVMTPDPSEQPFATFNRVESRSLRSTVGDDIQFEVRVAEPAVSSDGRKDGFRKIARRVLFRAECEDVEGNTVEPFSISIQLHQISPKMVPVFSPTTGISNMIMPTKAGYELLWSILPPTCVNATRIETRRNGES